MTALKQCMNYVPLSISLYLVLGTILITRRYKHLLGCPRDLILGGSVNCDVH